MRSVVAWAPAAVAAVWAVVRLGGLERGHPAVALMSFTPLVVLGGVVAAALALALGRRVPAAVALVSALALAAAIAPRVVGGPTGAAGVDGPTIGVLTVNLQLGEADPGAVVALARRTGADVLSLQEMDREAVRELRAAGLSDLLPHAVVDAGGGSGGTAVFAAVPLTALPAAGDRVAHARAAFPGAPALELTAVHPVPPRSAGGVDPWREYLRALPPAGEPLRILAGDFNATLDHRELRRLLGTGYEDAAEQAGKGLVATWPVGRPFPPLTIDHVLVDERCGVREVSVHTLPDTDHRAVFAEVVLPAG